MMRPHRRAVDATRGFATHSPWPAFVILGIICVLLWNRFGWRGPAVLVGGLVALVGLGTLLERRTERRQAEAWRSIFEAFDAAAAGGTPPPREVWQRWLRAVAGRAWSQEAEIRARLTQTANPLREMIQQLGCSLGGKAVAGPLLQQLQAHPTDPLAPRMAVSCLKHFQTPHCYGLIQAMLPHHPPEALRLLVSEIKFQLLQQRPPAEQAQFVAFARAVEPTILPLLSEGDRSSWEYRCTQLESPSNS